MIRKNAHGVASGRRAIVGRNPVRQESMVLVVRGEKRHTVGAKVPAALVGLTATRRPS